MAADEKQINLNELDPIIRWFYATPDPLPAPSPTPPPVPLPLEPVDPVEPSEPVEPVVPTRHQGGAVVEDGVVEQEVEDAAVEVEPCPLAAAPLYLTLPPGGLINTSHEPSGAVATYYTKAGWACVPIPWNAKGPAYKGWNLPTGAGVPWDHVGNLGLAHAYSRTCAIDIDDLAKATAWLQAEYGMDLEELLHGPQAVRIESGRAGRAKLLCQLPPGCDPMPSVSIYLDNKPIIDFRCGTRDGKTVQDVLPPSLHPETNRPYTWGGAGDWRSLPTLDFGLWFAWGELLKRTGGGGSVKLVSGKDGDGDEWSERLGRALDGQFHQDDARRLGGGAGGATGGGTGGLNGARHAIGQAGGRWATDSDDVWQWETPEERARKAREALTFLNPDTYMSQWAAIGYSLKCCGLEWEDFDTWSRQSAKYRGEWETRNLWDKGDINGPAKAGTVFWLAQEAGWKGNVPPRPPVEVMFDPAAIAAATPPPLEVDSATGAVVGAWVARPGDGSPEGQALLDDLRARLSDGSTLTWASPAVIQGLLVELATTVVNQPVVDAEVDQLTALEVDQILQRLKTLTGVSLRTLRSSYTGAYKDAKRSKRALKAKPVDTVSTSVLAHAIEVALQPVHPHPPLDLRILSERYFWVVEEGLFFDRLTGAWLTREKFNGAYMGLGYQFDDHGNPVYKPNAADELLAFPGCVKIQCQDFWPGKETIFQRENETLAINPWIDDGVKPVKGDVSTWLDHLEWLIADEKQRNYFIQWMAAVLRDPDQKINHNVILGGVARIGKDAAILPLQQGLGSCGQNENYDSERLIDEHYQDFAVNKKLFVLNELKIPGASSRKVENKLKPFGAAPPAFLRLRRLGKPDVVARNLVQIIAMTNIPIPITLEEPNRWFCIWCDPTLPHGRNPETPDTASTEEQSYYQKLYNWMNHEGGVAAVVHYLMNDVDMTGFQATSVAPATEWRSLLQSAAMESHPIETALRDLISEGSGAFTRDVVKTDDLVPAVKARLADDRSTNVNRVTVFNALSTLSKQPDGPLYRSSSIQADDGKTKKFRLWAIRKQSEYKNAKGKEWVAEADRVLSIDPMKGYG